MVPRCPVCKTVLTRIEDEGIRSQTCGGCFGTWIGKMQLTRLVRQPLPSALAQVPLEELAALVTESNTKRILQCPECGLSMKKVRFHDLVPVNLDRCPKCESFWLDAGELSLLRRLYAELMQSDDPRITRLREKIGQANIAWAERRAHLANAAAEATTMAQEGDFTLNTLLRILIG